jgi:hypothetical protein
MNGFLGFGCDYFVSLDSLLYERDKTNNLTAK